MIYLLYINDKLSLFLYNFSFHTELPYIFAAI